MGCCISSNKKLTLPPKPPVMLESDSNNRENRAPPPPPCLEEETIKEVVLSETPLPTPQQHPILQERNIEAKALNLIINKHEQEEEEEEEEEEEISQVSELYSISESFSTTTTTTTATTGALTEIKDDEAISKETRRESNYRSPAAKVPRRHPNARGGGAKPRAKRADDSSRVLSRPVPGRTVTRNVGPTTGLRRERGGGSSSSQRLRSSGTETAGGGVGRTRSPGKMTTGRASGKLRREENNEGKKKEEEVNGDVLMEKRKLNESLDNPHVSLECFIFL